MPTNYVEVARIIITSGARGPQCSVSVRVNHEAPYDIINVKLSGTLPIPNTLKGYNVYNYTGILVSGTTVANDFNTRFFNENAITQFCDGTTKITLSPSINAPFTNVEVEHNSNYCGSLPPTLCTLGIERVDTIDATSGNNGQAEIIPAGLQPGDILEFNLNGGAYDLLNVFNNLEPDEYFGYVRNQHGCTASLQFTIYNATTSPFRILKVDTTPESELLNDGTAEIIAAGIGAPFTYSLNNSNYQSSSIFTELAPGAYIAYAKNTSNVVVQLAFQVKMYVEFLIKRPSIKLDNNNTSRWIAAFNNINFKFKRRDFIFSTIIQDSASLKAKLIFDIQTGINAGSFIMLVSNKYNGPYLVSAVVGNNVIIDTDFIGTDNGGYIIVNSKINYRLELELTINDKIIKGYSSSDSRGIISIQLQSKLKPFLKCNNDFKYDVTNSRDINAAQSFTIRYRELYEGYIGEWQYEAMAYHFVNAAKQLGENYGGNMADYVTFLNRTAKAKFLSGFKEPTFFSGYPFDLSFIYSENIIGTAISRSDTFSNINKQPISSSGAILASETNVAFLNADNSLILIDIPSSTSQALTASVGIHRLKINESIPNLACYNQVKLTWNDAGTIKDITETKLIKINAECRKVPIYLCWLNTLGGWDYWLFDASQKSEISAGNIKTFEKFVDDFENAQGFVETLSKEAQVKITLGDNGLSIDDFHGIKGILYSPKVLMLTVQYPIKWHTVILDSKSFSYETDQSSTDIEFSIILPNIIVQNQ